MTDRDRPESPPPAREEVASKVTSIADRIRRRDAQRALEKARRAVADHTWASESTLELAESAAILEQLDLDSGMPEGADQAAREGRAALLCARANRAHLRGDDEAAFADWARALEAAPHADSHILRGAIRCARGDTEGALEDLDRAAELAPTDPAVFFRRGEVFARVGDHERALANYRRCQQLAPALLSNLSVMATSYLALGDARGALGVLDRAVRAAPHYADLFLRRGLCHASLDNHDAALRDYDRSLDLNPRQAVVLRLRAGVLQARGLHDQAIADLVRACELQPEDVENRRVLGWTRIIAAPDAATVAELTELIELSPDHDILYYLRAQAQRRAGDLRAALADLETAARLDPTCLGHVMGLSAVLCEIDGPKACLVHLDRMIGLAPTDARLWGARGRVRATEGKHEEALDDFDTALSLDPGLAVLHFERAKALDKTGDDDGAAAAGMTRAIELEPSRGEHYAWRGLFRIPLDHPREDVGADFDRAVELAPSATVTWLYRAMFYESEGRWEDAIRDLDEAIGIEPGLGVLYFRRGSCRRDLGVQIIDDSTDEDGPTDDEEQRAKDLTREALADFERCLELGTENWQVHEQIFYARSELEDQDGALASLDAAIATGAPGTWHHYLRSGLRRQRGDDAGARKDMATALERGYVVQDPREMQALREYAGGAPPSVSAP